MADPQDRENPKPQEAEDRGDEHIPTPDGEEEGEQPRKPEALSAEDLAAVAAEGQVPYARFKEADRTAREEREARIALEAENRVLRERATPAAAAVPQVDIRALRKQAIDKMLEGDSDAAADLNEQADREVKRQADAEADARIDAAIEKRELRAAAAKVCEDYPWLDSRNPERNRDAIAETMALRNVYIGEGFTQAEALKKAVKFTVERWTKGGEGSAEGDDDLARRRNAVALSRSAAAARNQPVGPTGGKGNRSTDKGPITDVSKLSDEEYRKLPESEKKKLRGD